MHEHSEITEFLDAVTPPELAMPLYMERGTIQTYDSVNKIVSVTIGGGINIIPSVNYLASYTPTAGDDVYILRFGDVIVVLGKIAR